MIKLFALLAVINGQQYIVASGITLADCHAEAQEVAAIELWDGQVIAAKDAVIYCVDESQLDELFPVEEVL